MDFYEEFRKLVFSRPHNAVSSRAVENCGFGDYIYRSKNVYLCYFCTELQDCYYCDHVHRSRDCTDCSYLQNCDLSYECTDGTGLYDCAFLQDCHNCSNCYFSYDLLNCQDCFGCFGLRNQRFSIFNKVYPEEQYREKLKKMLLFRPHEILTRIEPEIAKYPRLAARLLKGGENCIGDYIYWSRNAYRCFNVRNVEDSAYVSDFEDMEGITRSTLDADFGAGLELCYECISTAFSTNCAFLYNCTFCSDSEYCIDCYSAQNCFGCVYLMNKQYCILNRQFTREEYMVAIAKIKEELKKTGAYGKSLAEVLKGSKI